MKKIVGILGMAAMLGSAAFAADPAANFALSEFTGSAEFGVKGNFVPEDVEFGMFNKADASIKFGFVTAGDKATTGDGVWGELKIKADATDATAIPAAAVDTAKIHFVNGDFSMAANILKPTLVYGGFTPASATPIVSARDEVAAPDAYDAIRTQILTAKEYGKDKPDGYKALGDKDTKDTWKYLENAAKVAYEASEKAGKPDIDKYNEWQHYAGVVAGIEANLKKIPAAPAAGATGLKTAGIGKDDGLAAGFGLEMKLEDMFALNFKLMDAGLEVAAKNQKYGMAFDASLLAVENLEASIAMSMNFDIKYTGLQAKAGYNFAINDKLYVKPAVTYEMVKAGDNTTNALAAGLLFGWGAKDVKPNMDYFQNAKGELPFNEGVSFAICPIIGEKDTDILMTIGAYDQSLFSMLGLEDYGTLKTAFGFDAVMLKNKAASKNTIRAALAYDVTFSPVYVSTHFGMNATLVGEKAEFKPDLKFGVKIGSKEVIDNTDVYVSYEMEKKAADEKKPSTNNLTIGTKISF